MQSPRPARLCRCTANPLLARIGAPNRPPDRPRHLRQEVVDDQQRVAAQPDELGLQAAGVVGLGEACDPLARGGEQELRKFEVTIRLFTRTGASTGARTWCCRWTALTPSTRWPPRCRTRSPWTPKTDGSTPWPVAFSCVDVRARELSSGCLGALAGPTSPMPLFPGLRGITAGQRLADLPATEEDPPRSQDPRVGVLVDPLRSEFAGEELRAAVPERPVLVGVLGDRHHEVLGS